MTSVSPPCISRKDGNMVQNNQRRNRTKSNTRGCHRSSGLEDNSTIIRRFCTLSRKMPMKENDAKV